LISFFNLHRQLLAAASALKFLFFSKASATSKATKFLAQVFTKLLFSTQVFISFALWLGVDNLMPGFAAAGIDLRLRSTHFHERCDRNEDA
jgi:hypothetical protein